MIPPSSGHTSKLSPVSCGPSRPWVRRFQHRKAAATLRRYFHCDVVPELISRNLAKFAGKSVDFRCLDMVDDDLPVADVAPRSSSAAAFEQYADQQNRSQALRLSIPGRVRTCTDRERFCAKCRKDGRCYHPPALPFRSCATWPPPFNLRVKSEKVICSNPQSIRSYKGIVNTTVYERDSYPSAVEIPVD